MRYNEGLNFYNNRVPINKNEAFVIDYYDILHYVIWTIVYEEVVVLRVQNSLCKLSFRYNNKYILRGYIDFYIEYSVILC